MARKKQTFDPHALTREVVSATHEVVTVPFRLRTYRVIRKILIIFIAVSIVNVVFANVFYTPKMYRMFVFRGCNARAPPRPRSACPSPT